MQMVLRVLVGIAGALALVVAARGWTAPQELATQFGLSPEGALGLATVRADLSGFFAGGGVLALAASFRGRGTLLTAPLLLIGLALTGRLITAATAGVPQETLPPMLVEMALVIVLGAGRLKMAP